MSLFLRIFLFFWLTAALLASSFFILGRVSGSEAIERAEDVLKAQADIVAAVWQEDGRRATRRWLFQQSKHNRPLLLNSQGQSPFKSHRIKRPPGLALPLKAGMIRQHRHIILIAMLPEINPPLFLVRKIDPMKMQRYPLWTWFAAAIAIISLVSFFLARVLSKRIRHLRYAVQEITEGNLNARVKLKGSDEVSALATDFNSMADRINDMLHSQRQLVSDVSHELRSPLARLRIAVELAQRSADPAKMLSRIAKEGDELESLVTGLLSLARIESSQFQLETQPVEITALIKKIVHDAEFEGSATNREINFETCAPVTLTIDPILVSSAIENVVRNALRYTPEHSCVQLYCKHQTNEFHLFIEDQGKGVAEESLQKLFKPFARVEEARDRKRGGYGLGLAITGKTMLAHGGQAIAQNRSEGGLRVILKFPLSTIASQ